MSEDLSDPEVFARLVVQQYLHEHGMQAALQATEKQHGLKFVPDKLPTGSMLLELIYKQMEERAAADDAQTSDSTAEEEALLRGGDKDYPKQLTHAIDSLHESSVISICAWPGSEHQIATGSGNGLIQLVDYEQDEYLWRHQGSTGGVLSLAFQPDSQPDQMLLLAGAMDGSVTVLAAATGNILARHKSHAKYCVRVRWAADGQRFVSCSWDHTLAVHRYHAETETSSIEVLQTEAYLSQIQDVEWVPAQSHQQGTMLVVALKNTNYLRLYDIETLKEHAKVNMNAMADEHVSFSASHLALSPCRKYLLVSTDGSRLIMFKVQDWTQTRNFYGLQVEEKFHQPCAAWHSSGFYIFAAAAAGMVAVFHVGTSKVEAQLKAHLKNVRALDYNPATNALVTCSFDKTVKVFT